MKECTRYHLALIFSLVLLAASSDAQAITPDFTEHLAATLENALRVSAVDLDDDGDIDLVAQGRHETAWYENLGGSPLSFTHHRISDHPNFYFEAHDVADVDNDGDLDVFAASKWAGAEFKAPGHLWWYESNGALPPSYSEHLIATDGEFRAIFATDLDGDGDTDLIAGDSYPSDKLVWYENDGTSSPSFTGRLIKGANLDFFGIFAADLDGDGDRDVITATWINDRITWYENLGGSPLSFTEHVLPFSFNDPRGLFAADLDEDGDIDIVYCSQGGDTVGWLESDGTVTPSFTRRTISTDVDAPGSVFVADIDGDGDLDVLSSSWRDDKIAWYESDGALPPSFTGHVISTNADGAASAVAADIDGDHHMDVVSASHNDDKVAWYENDTNILSDIQDIIDANPETPLADKMEDALAGLQTAQTELDKTPPDNQAAVGNIEGSVGDIEAAIDEGLDPVEAEQLMDQLAGIARQLAMAAIDDAIDQGGDPTEIAEAQQALAEGDVLRDTGAFKDAINKYKDALAKAEGAIG